MVSFWADGYAVVVDGVVGPWFLDVLRTSTPKLMTLDYVILLPALEVVVRRVGTRAVHPMRDLAATEHMHGQFAAIGDEYVRHVLDSSLTPAELVRQIDEGRTTGRFHLFGA
jgi:hypothetical protein